jgi:hypothetical protein
VVIDALASRYGDDDEERAALKRAVAARLDALRREGGKRCSRCETRLPLDAFGPRADAPDGLRSACRRCEAERFRGVSL